MLSKSLSGIGFLQQWPPAQSYRHKRLRLAVSPQEYEEIREYMITTFGEFYGRILRNVPLSIEPDPEKSLLIVDGSGKMTDGAEFIVIVIAYTLSKKLKPDIRFFRKRYLFSLPGLRRPLADRLG